MGVGKTKRRATARVRIAGAVPHTGRKGAFGRGMAEGAIVGLAVEPGHQDVLHFDILLDAVVAALAAVARVLDPAERD